MRVITPTSIDQTRTPGVPVVFLAGSIDEGRAEAWQDRAIEALADLDVIVLNPRRERWNPELRQDVDEPEFAAQVDWELDGIEDADVVLFHFSPGGQAPITLLEIGYAVASSKRIVVSCPEGYWRRGNVQVLCRRSSIPVQADLESAVTIMRTLVDGARGAPERIVPMPVSIGGAIMIRRMIRGVPAGSQMLDDFASEATMLEDAATSLLARDFEGEARRRSRTERPVVIGREMDEALGRALMASTTHVADPFVID